MLAPRALWVGAALFVAACSSASGELPNDAPSSDLPDHPAGGSETRPPGTTETETPSPSPVPPCTTDLGPELARLKVPGLSAGIVKKGKLICTAVAGMANIAEPRPVTPNTLFAWASVSKTVTAVTLMTLFDEGKFALDDDINPKLPFKVRVPSCTKTAITFRHLLTHTSSITEDDETGAYADSYVQGDSPIALGTFLRDYLVSDGKHYDARDNFERACPGTIASYSNVGAGLIGYLAEVIANKPFDELAKERVFEPLGMNEASFRLKDLDVTHVAMPYETSGAAFTPVGHFGFPTYPDGLLRASVPELARFLAMFMELGELDGVRVLAKTTAEEMRRIQLPNVDDAQALIWYTESFPGRKRVLGHDGGDPGVSSNMYFDPEDGSGVLLVANGEWAETAANELMGKLFAEAAQK